MTRLPLPDSVTSPGVVAVMRAAHGRDYATVGGAILDGGVTALELTLTTPGTLEELPYLRRMLPGACIGVGSVTGPEDARAAIAAGAQYLVTPTVDVAVARIALDADTPLLMGALTPTEVMSAWRAGAAAVKIFPATTVGPGYPAQLRGPMPDIEVVPSGGIGVDDIGPWISAGARAVSVGGPLLADAFNGGDLGALTERAQAMVAAVAAARSRA